MEVKQILYQMCNSLDDFDKSEIYISLLPIVSSVCLGWIDKFQKHGKAVDLPDVQGVDFITMLKSVRIGLKLYSDKRVANAFKRLNTDANERKKMLETNYNFLQKFRVSVLGQPDLGIFTINDMPYGNTSQMSIYLEGLFSLNKFETINQWGEGMKPIMIDYSQALSTFINSIATEFEENFTVDSTMKLNISNYKLSYVDKFLMDTNRQNILLGDLLLEAQLQLFNILCQNNFINVLLPNIFQSTGNLFYRSKLQSYLVSVHTIKKLVSKYSESIDFQLVNELEKIIEVKNNFFSANNQFRNNIFHYSITEISFSNFSNPQNYFREFVESYIDISFDDFMKIIDEEIEKINRVVEQLIKYR
ncbi:hypothetical protein FXF62_05005 [Streptococcus cristatus]|uniref:Uncharacterized protein n=1 Tax=Streptococcus cristatus TaxID=45634 RepID=A0A5B0DCZ2_STRCR|nr:hypothetical protein FXF62_05005 [Streptococcus cristatus]